jgi:hypothetical protein
MYGLTQGKTRGAKGRLVEKLLEAIVSLAWHEIGGEVNRINIEKLRVTVPINANYVKNLIPESTRNYVVQNVDKYIFRLELDRVVEIDNRLVLAIECKAFTDNTMFKRSLKEFELIVKLCYPKLLFCIFQLENGLGGDYGNASNPKQLGSGSTHTLLSHTPEVSLEIITLLDGNGSSSKPIHNPKFFKELPVENVAVCVSKFRSLLEPFV